LRAATPEPWRAVILEPASAFGFETDFWTAKRVHQVITQQFPVSVAPRTVVRRLQEAGLSYQKPTREYFELAALRTLLLVGGQFQFLEDG
jgi:transposase